MRILEYGYMNFDFGCQPFAGKQISLFIDLSHTTGKEKETKAVA